MDDMSNSASDKDYSECFHNSQKSSPRREQDIPESNVVSPGNENIDNIESSASHISHLSSCGQSHIHSASDGDSLVIGEECRMSNATTPKGGSLSEVAHHMFLSEDHSPTPNPISPLVSGEVCDVITEGPPVNSHLEANGADQMSENSQLEAPVPSKPSSVSFNVSPITSTIIADVPISVAHKSDKDFFEEYTNIDDPNENERRKAVLKVMKQLGYSRNLDKYSFKNTYFTKPSGAVIHIGSKEFNSLISRLYKPENLRRLTEEEMKRRKQERDQSEYNSVNDVHLHGYWSAKRVKRRDRAEKVRSTTNSPVPSCEQGTEDTTPPGEEHPIDEHAEHGIVSIEEELSHLHHSPEKNHTKPQVHISCPKNTIVIYMDDNCPSQHSEGKREMTRDYIDDQDSIAKDCHTLGEDTVTSEGLCDQRDTCEILLVSDDMTRLMRPSTLMGRERMALPQRHIHGKNTNNKMSHQASYPMNRVDVLKDIASKNNTNNNRPRILKSIKQLNNTNSRDNCDVTDAAGGVDSPYRCTKSDMSPPHAHISSITDATSDGCGGRASVNRSVTSKNNGNSMTVSTEELAALWLTVKTPPLYVCPSGCLELTDSKRTGIDLSWLLNCFPVSQKKKVRRSKVAHHTPMSRTGNSRKVKNTRSVRKKQKNIRFTPKEGDHEPLTHSKSDKESRLEASNPAPHSEFTQKVKSASRTRNTHTKSVNTSAVNTSMCGWEHDDTGVSNNTVESWSMDVIPRCMSAVVGMYPVRGYVPDEEIIGMHSDTTDADPSEEPVKDADTDDSTEQKGVSETTTPAHKRGEYADIVEGMTFITLCDIPVDPECYRLEDQCPHQGDTRSCNGQMGSETGDESPKNKNLSKASGGMLLDDKSTDLPTKKGEVEKFDTKKRILSSHASSTGNKHLILNSPRSSLVLLRRGLVVEDLMPTTDTSLIEGNKVHKTVLQRRFLAREDRRKAHLTAALSDYKHLTSIITRSEIVDLLVENGTNTNNSNSDGSRKGAKSLVNDQHTINDRLREANHKNVLSLKSQFKKMKEENALLEKIERERQEARNKRRDTMMKAFESRQAYLEKKSREAAMIEEINLQDIRAKIARDEAYLIEREKKRKEQKIKDDAVKFEKQDVLKEHRLHHERQKQYELLLASHRIRLKFDKIDREAHEEEIRLKALRQKREEERVNDKREKEGIAAHMLAFRRKYRI